MLLKSVQRKHSYIVMLSGSAAGHCCMCKCAWQPVGVTCVFVYKSAYLIVSDRFVESVRAKQEDIIIRHTKFNLACVNN